MSFKGNDMLLRILAEGIKEERLEEKKKSVNIKLNPSRNKISGFGKGDRATTKAVYDSHSSFIGAILPNIDYGALVARVAAVADNADDDTLINKKDIFVPYFLANVSATDTSLKTDAQKNIKEIEALVALMNDENKVYVEEAKKEAIELANNTNKGIPDDDDRKKAVYSFTRKLVDTTKSLEDVFEDDPVFKTLVGGGIYDPFATPSMADVDSSAVFKEKESGGTDFTKFEEFQTVAKQSIIKTFDSVVDMGVGGNKFSNTSPTDNLGDGLMAMSNFGKFISGREPQKQIEKYNLQQSMQFMTNAAAYIALADISRRGGGVEAGLLFEKYLAIAFNMPVAGGSNGAADNIAQHIRSKNATAYVSAKMYGEASIKDISQSESGSEGVEALVKDAGQTVLYISIAKSTGKSAGKEQEKQYTEMKVYVSTLSWDKKSGEYYGSVLNSKGKDGLRYKCETSGGQVPLLPTNTTQFSQVVGNPTYTIQVPLIDEARVKNTKDFLDQVTVAAGNDMVDSLKKAFVEVQKLSDSMSNYRSSKGTGQEVQISVKKMSDRYQAIYSQIQSLFGEEKNDKSAEQGSVFATGKKQSFAIAESRQIADVIKEMTKKQLKKR